MNCKVLIEGNYRVEEMKDTIKHHAPVVNVLNLNVLTNENDKTNLHKIKKINRRISEIYAGINNFIAIYDQDLPLRIGGDLPHYNDIIAEFYMDEGEPKVKIVKSKFPRFVKEQKELNFFSFMSILKEIWGFYDIMKEAQQ